MAAIVGRAAAIGARKFGSKIASKIGRRSIPKISRRSSSNYQEPDFTNDSDYPDSQKSQNKFVFALLKVINPINYLFRLNAILHLSILIGFTVLLILLNPFDIIGEIKSKDDFKKKLLKILKAVGIAFAPTVLTLFILYYLYAIISL